MSEKRNKECSFNFLISRSRFLYCYTAHCMSVLILKIVQCPVQNYLCLSVRKLHFWIAWLAVTSSHTPFVVSSQACIIPVSCCQHCGRTVIIFVCRYHFHQFTIGRKRRCSSHALDIFFVGDSVSRACNTK